MTRFDVTTLAFMRDLYRIIGWRKQVPPSLKGQTEGKCLASGSAGMGNTQCSVILYQADWIASMRYQ
jgi:hypothetical protein